MEHTNSSLKGKTALVTGSCDGIGHAMAAGLARAGCNVVLHGIEPAAGAQPLQAALERAYGVAAGYVQADLSDPDAIAAMMGQVAQRHGGVDILVNNAVTRTFAPIESFPVAAWDQALAVNLSAAFHTIRLALPLMRERGWGRIFNMTSVYGARAVGRALDRRRPGAQAARTVRLGRQRLRTAAAHRRDLVAARARGRRQPDAAGRGPRLNIYQPKENS